MAMHEAAMAEPSKVSAGVLARACRLVFIGALLGVVACIPVHSLTTAAFTQRGLELLCSVSSGFYLWLTRGERSPSRTFAWIVFLLATAWVLFVVSVVVLFVVLSRYFD